MSEPQTSQCIKSLLSGSIEAEYLRGSNDSQISFPWCQKKTKKLQQTGVRNFEWIFLLAPGQPLSFRGGQGRTCQEMWYYCVSGALLFDYGGISYSLFKFYRSTIGLEIRESVTKRTSPRLKRRPTCTLPRRRRLEVSLPGPWCLRGATGDSTRAPLASRVTEHRVNNLAEGNNDTMCNIWCLQVNLLPYNIECRSEKRIWRHYWCWSWRN